MYDQPVEDRDIRTVHEQDAPNDAVAGRPAPDTDEMAGPAGTDRATHVMATPEARADTGVMDAPGGTAETDVMAPPERVSPFIAPVRPARHEAPARPEDDAER